MTNDALERLRALEENAPRQGSENNRQYEDWRDEIAELVGGPLDDPNAAHEIYMYGTAITEIRRIVRRVITEHKVKRSYPAPAPPPPQPSTEERVAEIQRAGQIEAEKIRSEVTRATQIEVAKIQAEGTRVAAEVGGKANVDAAKWGAPPVSSVAELSLPSFLR